MNSLKKNLESIKYLKPLNDSRLSFPVCYTTSVIIHYSDWQSLSLEFGPTIISAVK